ncbi:MAG: hypothetical protein ACR2G7_01495 [Acidimicrobiales bacterium]
MRLRIGFVLGFGAGYYLGARAGRSRYEQFNRLLAKARRSDAYETAAGTAKTLVDEGAHRAKEVVDEGIERAQEVVEDGIERAKEVVEERRGTDGRAPAQVADPGFVDTSLVDPAFVVSDPSPGPPPLGSLDDPPT